MTRLRLGVLLALAVALGVSSLAPKAMAAAEVHRLNWVISANPSQLSGSGMNDLINRYNENPLGLRGLQSMDKITMGWMFESELRYFVRPNFAVTAGFGHLKARATRRYEYLGSSIDIAAQVLAVPVHVGAVYYMAPYNQGDFQARAFVGGGLLSLTSTRAYLHTAEWGLPGSLDGDTLNANSLGGNNSLAATGDGAGYYAEVGAHMFFASRFSIIVGAVYRSARIRELKNTGGITVPDLQYSSGQAVYLPTQLKYKDSDAEGVRIGNLDLSGIGARMAVAIGF